MRKSSVGKSPKTSPKREKTDWERPAKSQNGRFDIHLATIKKLPETPLRFTGTIRHAPKPTGLPAKRQPKPPFPCKQETAKPMRIVYFPPRPHSSPNERFSRGETYFLTFCLTLLLHIHHGKLVLVTLKMNTEQTSRDTTKKDRLRIYPEAVLSTLLYRYSLLV